MFFIVCCTSVFIFPTVRKKEMLVSKYDANHHSKIISVDAFSYCKFRNVPENLIFANIHECVVNLRFLLITNLYKPSSKQ